jgi:copper chaperone CopZ
MTCGGCEASIVKVLGALDGVAKVTADHGTGQVVLEFGEGNMPSDEDLSLAVTRAGFTRVG